MVSELRRCIKCDWIGYSSKLALCPSCETTYYKCPICGNKTKYLKKIS